MNERTLCLEIGAHRLVGVLHEPATSKQLGVIIVVGGPQYRVGSHRQFVLLARSLAEAGYPVLRFDYRGMGDSDGEARTFEDIDDDIRAGIDCLMREASASRGVVLWGLCDAASASLIYAPLDARVIGLALLNPWVRTEAGIAEVYVKHYYLRRIASGEFWHSLLRGKVSVFGALRELLRNVSLAKRSADTGVDFTERMRRAAEAFGGRMLLVISGRDLTAMEFEAHCSRSASWHRVLQRTSTERHLLSEADHTFSTRAWRDEVAEWTRAWLDRIAVAS